MKGMIAEKWYVRDDMYDDIDIDMDDDCDTSLSS